MDGEEARTRLVCMQDIARNYMVKLLMYFITQWPNDRPRDPPGRRLHDFLSARNKNNRIYDELNQQPNLNKKAVLYGDGFHFQNPVEIELLDITSLCIILELDVNQFPTRLAKHRRNGVSQLMCPQIGHLAGCCSNCCGSKCGTKCNHHESFGGRKCRKTRCGRSMKQCIEGSAPCCTTCNSCQRCKQAHGLPLCPSQKLRETIQNIRTFRNLVAHKTLDAFNKLKTGNFVDDRFPNCPDFESLSAKCGSSVKELLDYLLNTVSFITQNDYDDAVTEISVTRRPDSFQLLERLYGHILGRGRDAIILKNFVLEFEMYEITGWNTAIRRLIGYDSNLTEDDLDLNSSLSTAVEECVRSFFKKHDIDNDSLELITVRKTNNNEWPVYKFVLKPISMEEQEFTREYQDRRSTKSRELWENLKDHIREMMSDKVNTDLNFRLCHWSLGSLIITAAIGKGSEEWRESERKLLDETLNCGSTSHHLTEFIYIESVTKISMEKENINLYNFRIFCSYSSAYGVDNVIKELPSEIKSMNFQRHSNKQSTWFDNSNEPMWGIMNPVSRIASVNEGIKDSSSISCADKISVRNLSLGAINISDEAPEEYAQCKHSDKRYRISF